MLSCCAQSSNTPRSCDDGLSSLIRASSTFRTALAAATSSDDNCMKCSPSASSPPSHEVPKFAEPDLYGGCATQYGSVSAATNKT